MKRVQRVVKAGAKKIEDMTQCEAEVLAMLIDTEGTISSSASHGSVYVTIRVGMESVIPILMFLKWGGKLFKRLTKKSGKWVYTWALRPRQRYSFLTKIKPHLLQKQKQAELALEMLRTSDKERKQQLRMEISRLNHLSPPDIDIKKLGDSRRLDDLR